MRLRGIPLGILLAGFLVCLIAVVYLIGVRYPPPQIPPQPAPTQSGDRTHDKTSDLRAASDGAIFQQRNGDRFEFRAFVPEPEITISGQAGRHWQIEVDNIHPLAQLVSDGAAVSEQKQNLKRIVSGTSAAARFSWRFHKHQQYRFAAIGDTGGGTELAWVLARAHALAVDFVLHLGDFYYGPGEYESTVAALAQARVPVYVAIGNHDFHDGFKSIHHQFRRYIGPHNSTFSLGRVQFVNLDTAAAIIPPHGGLRGRFIRELEIGAGIEDIVVFTHKPLADLRRGKEHSVSRWEADYLRGELQRLGVRTLLAGHIHIQDDFDDAGIRTIITGQGLAHADLIVEKPVAEILIGEVGPDEKRVSFHWSPINMPFESHCSPRAWEVLVVLDKPEVLRRLKNICAEN